MTATETAFARRYGPWALIAGASDGTGAAFARAFADQGVNVVLVARRQGVLDDVASEVRAVSGVEVRVVVLDLARSDAVSSLVRATADLEIGSLVYNAGADVHPGPFLTYPMEDARAMVQRNCVVPMELCQHFASAMRTRARGAIVLVSSASGLFGMPTMAVYGATKAFDIVLAEGLWADLHDHGVDVLAPILASTDTPAPRRVLVAQGVLASMEDPMPIPTAVSAESVAEGVLANLANGPTWFAGDFVHDRSEQLRSMTRNEAVRSLYSQITGRAAT